MSMVAIIPVANLVAANNTLNNTGSDANVYEPGVWGWVKI